MSTSKASSRRLSIVGRRRFTSDPWRYAGVVYGCDYIDSRLINSVSMMLTLKAANKEMRVKPPIEIDEQANAELRQQ